MNHAREGHGFEWYPMYGLRQIEIVNCRTAQSGEIGSPASQRLPISSAKRTNVRARTATDQSRISSPVVSMQMQIMNKHLTWLAVRSPRLPWRNIHGLPMMFQGAIHRRHLHDHAGKTFQYHLYLRQAMSFKS